MYRRYTNGKPHPPIENVFDVPDSGGIPEVFALVAQNCRKLSDELLDIQWFRGWSLQEVARRAEISEQAAEDLIKRGKGSDEDFFALCDALNIYVYEFPSREDMAKGFE